MRTVLLLLFRFARLLFSGHATVAVENGTLRLQLTWRRRQARFFTRALTGLVLFIVLTVVALFVYPSTRPPARTVRPAGTISVDVPFRFTRAFIDYMTLQGQGLYVAFTSHDLVGLIDTRASRGIGAVSQLSHVYGIALVPGL